MWNLSRGSDESSGRVRSATWNELTKTNRSLELC